MRVGASSRTGPLPAERRHPGNGCRDHCSPFEWSRRTVGHVAVDDSVAVVHGTDKLPRPFCLPLRLPCEARKRCCQAAQQWLNPSGRTSSSSALSLAWACLVSLGWRCGLGGGGAGGGVGARACGEGCVCPGCPGAALTWLVLFLRRRRRRRCPCDCPWPLAWAGSSSDWPGRFCRHACTSWHCAIWCIVCLASAVVSPLLSFLCLSPVQVWTGTRRPAIQSL